jgi:hypothetical protein
VLFRSALFYIEPVATFDLDIFIILPESSGKLISLSPLYSWLEKRGCKPSKEQVIIEGVAVQFIPVYNELVKDGVLDAVDKMYGNTNARVLRPEYLVAIMLQTYRPKDKDRIIKFLQETELNFTLLNSILQKHNLVKAFENFRRQFFGSQT